MHRSLKWGVAVAAAIVQFFMANHAAQADDGASFTSPTGLYSLTISPGWELDKTGTGTNKVDAAFAPDGDPSRGSVYITLSNAQGSLEDERSAYVGGAQISGEHHVTINGIDCLAFTSSTQDGQVINESVICHVSAPTGDGALHVAVIMTSSVTPSHYAQQKDVFWQIANSIVWGRGIAP